MRFLVSAINWLKSKIVTSPSLTWKRLRVKLNEMSVSCDVWVVFILLSIPPETRRSSTNKFSLQAKTNSFEKLFTRLAFVGFNLIFTWDELVYSLIWFNQKKNFSGCSPHPVFNQHVCLFLTRSSTLRVFYASLNVMEKLKLKECWKEAKDFFSFPSTTIRANINCRRSQRVDWEIFSSILKIFYLLID